ncbi:MAG TPA: dihydroneopterin aldolase [Polyangiaceae bacterium]|nr:dihydroneopterin aldolase [Polyangiaceae bacterium]
MRARTPEKPAQKNPARVGRPPAPSSPRAGTRPAPSRTPASASAPTRALDVGHAVAEYVLRLDGIRFRGHHGVSDSERALPQDFLVSLEVYLPLEVLPTGDHIADVYNYDRLATLVVEEGTEHRCLLLETLAQRVIARVLKDTPATRVSVAVTKSRPPTRSSVDSVTVELRARRA